MNEHSPAEICRELSERDDLKLTNWERDFLAKMTKLVERGWELSGAQKQKLDQIYEERIPQ